MDTLKEYFDFLQEKYPTCQLSSDSKLIDFDSLNNAPTYKIDINTIQLVINQYNEFPYPSITCGILTYNEEKNITNCLKSVENVFDEIIVLDSFSSDKTTSIINASFNNVKILYSDWINDFSHHRNFIINNSTSDWIFFIDADNIYDKCNCKNAHRVAKLLSFFNLNVTTSPIIIEHDKSYSTDNRRLFPLKSNIYFNGKVHEEPFCDGCSLDDLPVKIKVSHHGYDSSLVDLNLKVMRNIRLTKEMLILEPFNAKWYYFYAKELFNIDLSKNVETIKSFLIKALDLYSQNKKYTRYKKETLSLLCRVFLYTKELTELSNYVNLLEEITSDCIDIIYYRTILIINQIKRRENIVINEIENTLLNEEDFFSFIHPEFNHLKTLLISIYLESGYFEKVSNLTNKFHTDMFVNDVLNKIRDLKVALLELENNCLILKNS